jgi:beta-mannosidase
MQTLSLNGNWQFQKTGDADWLPAAVPGCVHTDLLANGQIPDPYYRDNEKDLQWIGVVDWLYTRRFDVPESLLQHEKVLLRCASLDTLATLTLNGQAIGKTDNQFRAWEFDVKDLLRPGENEISILFESALRYGQARLQERYIHSWSTEDHKLPGGNYVRKSQCNFGWDWGPKLVTCGILRDIELIAFSTARLDNFYVRQEHSAGRVDLTVAIEAEVIGAGQLEARVAVRFEGVEIASGNTALPDGRGSIAFQIDQPRLWWPNGMGEQPLYEVEVRVMSSSLAALDGAVKSIGLRTLKLVRQPDHWGESFRFEANGVPFFAKGSNWIPADTLVTRVTPADYERLLRAAKDTHQNMLRAWGGGIYEPDIFFDLCDRLGITIWQDFMFGCATYPTFEDAFMANVEEEARQQIKRIRHHASLALWCGNNELEQGLVDDEWTATAMSWEDYGKLYDKRLKELTAELDPQTDYWPASPHTPIGDRRDFNNPNSGDAHIWDVWHGLKPFEFYRTCYHRFNSEFGFQSFPEPRTVRAYTIPSDYSLNSPVMDHHQRSPSGNARIIHYMLDWFRLPTNFWHQLMLSQILQGMAIKYAVEHWRRTMPRGMGTIYWQLNDCWPVASWSSIDSLGRWKALHFMARRFFAPLHISGLEDWDAGTVEIHVTNDHQTPFDVTVHWKLMTAETGEPVLAGQFDAGIPALANTRLTTLNLSEMLTEPGKTNLILHLELHTGGQKIADNLTLFCRPKQLELADPRISLTVEGSKVTLSADKPALWVWLDTDADLILPDNFFHLVPGGDVTLEIDSPLRGEALRAALRVSSLWDTFQP